MRASLTLFASAMLATASLVLAAEEVWITETEEVVVELSTYWKPKPHHHTPPASWYPKHYSHHSYTGTGSYYPWHHPATTTTVFITVYPESCAPTPTSSSKVTSFITTSPVPLPSNSAPPATPSYIPPNGTYGTNSTNATNGTSPISNSDAAPMGIGFMAGIVGALGVLFAML